MSFGGQRAFGDQVVPQMVRERGRFHVASDQVALDPLSASGPTLIRHDLVSVVGQGGDGLGALDHLDLGVVRVAPVDRGKPSVGGAALVTLPATWALRRRMDRC